MLTLAVVNLEHLSSLRLSLHASWLAVIPQIFGLAEIHEDLNPSVISIITMANYWLYVILLYCNYECLTIGKELTIKGLALVYRLPNQKNWDNLCTKYTHRHYIYYATHTYYTYYATHTYYTHYTKHTHYTTHTTLHKHIEHTLHYTHLIDHGSSTKATV